MRPFHKRLVFSLASSTANKILDLMPPLLVAWVIDSVAGSPPEWIIAITGKDDAWKLATMLSVLAVIIFALESLFQWMYQFGFQTLSQKVQHSLRTRTYDHLQKRETEFFENHRLGNTLSILNDDINQLERFLNVSFNEIVQLFVIVCFTSFVMVKTSAPLALFALIPIPVIIISSLYYQKHLSPRYAKIREAVGSLNSRLENNLAGMAVIQSFTAEDFEYDRVQKESEQYRDANIHAIKLNILYVPIIRLAIALGFAGVLLLGSHWILSGSDILSIGELVLFSMIIQRLLWPLTRLGFIIDEYERAGASARRIFELLATPSTIVDPDPSTSLADRARSLTGNIQFKSVHFAYTPEIPILNGFTVDIKAGETVGIAGTTGSGKSTLIKCLLRLYDIQSGQISFDGIPIQDIPLKDLRRQIALVSQDIYLFHGTIFENIAYGLPGASREDVIQAAKSAHLHEFIESCPHGYDSIVGERGIKLSGGQRQRLSIARAILKDAPIMVFDEATSSVDTETERDIQANINELTQGKTALIIAHRLSTIRHANRILVIQDGTLIEDGTHEQLVNTQGVYSDLWAIQTGGA